MILTEGIFNLPLPVVITDNTLELLPRRPSLAYDAFHKAVDSHNGQVTTPKL
jgi:hypothetical protein